MALAQGVMSEDDWMNDQREFFTFLTSEQERIVKGYELLFSRRFSKSPVRSDFERNNDHADVRANSEDETLLAREAARTLGVKE